MTHDPASAGTAAGASGSPTRRRFLRLAAAAAAMPVAGCTADAASSAKKAAKRPSPKPTVAENSRPGDPNWGISNLGGPNAMIGYAGQASVLPGEAITLYASTTAPSFVVRAFRMG